MYHEGACHMDPPHYDRMAFIPRSAQTMYINHQRLRYQDLIFMYASGFVSNLAWAAFQPVLGAASGRCWAFSFRLLAGKRSFIDIASHEQIVVQLGLASEL